MPKILPAEMDSAADLERLAAYRLEHDLTFAELAAQMHDAGYPVGLGALRVSIARRHHVQPLERTRYKISRFLATRVAKPKPARRRRAAAA